MHVCRHELLMLTATRAEVKLKAIVDIVFGPDAAGTDGLLLNCTASGGKHAGARNAGGSPGIGQKLLARRMLRRLPSAHRQAGFAEHAVVCSCV